MSDPVLPSSSHALLDRVESLERRCRRQQWLLRTVVVVLGALPLLAVARAPGAAAGTVDVRRLRLVDEAGALRGEWRATENGAELTVFDAAGRRRVELVADGDDARVAVRDREEHKRVGLAVDPLLAAHVLVQDPLQRPRLHLAVGADGAPGLLLSDADGDRPAGLGVKADGTPWTLPAARPDAPRR